MSLRIINHNEGLVVGAMKSFELWYDFFFELHNCEQQYNK